MLPCVPVISCRYARCKIKEKNEEWVGGEWNEMIGRTEKERGERGMTKRLRV
jgi:hypothetical protein